jgi:signal peptidase I
VIGLPGDRVACCAPDGRLTVNGAPVSEDYVHPGDAPSMMKFDVEVPAERLWLMGDHRSVSADSRSLLGAPGGGMVPVDRVIGRPMEIIWPLDRGRQLERAPLGGASATDEGQ